jgi:hypothetical protein
VLTGHPVVTRLSTTCLSAISAAMITSPATAYADCGDAGQEPCTGPVPTVDQVMAIVNELIDSDIPAANKTDIVTPGFTPEEAREIDDHLHDMDARRYPPMNIVISNIQPAPNNYAGATLAAYNGYKTTPPGPIVLIEQNGHWLITNDTAKTALDAFWFNSNLRRPFVSGNSI